MKESNNIPSFKKKELSLQYLSDSFEDDSKIQIKILEEVISDFDFKLDLKQLMTLYDYQLKAFDYAFELMSILTGKIIQEGMVSDLKKFREDYAPETMAEKVIFNIFKDVCGEFFWINSIFDMEEEIYDGDL